MRAMLVFHSGIVVYCTIRAAIERRAFQRIAAEKAAREAEKQAREAYWKGRVGPWSPSNSVHDGGRWG